MGRVVGKILVFLAMVFLWIHQIYTGYYLFGATGVVLGIMFMPVSVVTPIIEALFWWPRDDLIGIYIVLYSTLALGLLLSRKSAPREARNKA